MLVFWGGGIWRVRVCCLVPFEVFVVVLVGFLFVCFFLNWALNLELGQMLQSVFKGFDQVWLLLFVSYPAGWAELEMEMNGPAGHREVEEVARLNCSPVAWNRSYLLSTLCAYWRLKGGIGKKERVIAAKETFQDYNKAIFAIKTVFSISREFLMTAVRFLL